MTQAVRFSVVTPTYGRPQSLVRMLDALGEQDHPFDSFEAVVVIDGGDPALAQELKRRRYPYRLRAVEQARSGPAAARNRGLEMATEPYVLFLDDDVIPERALVRRHAESHREQDVVVIGPLLAATSSRAHPWTRWEWATLKEQYRAMEAGEWAPTPRQFYTGNASVRIDHVRAAGGFNPNFKRGEDVELAWRLHDRGLRFIFDPLARAQHLAERSFEAWLRAAHEYGRTDVMLERIRTGRDLPGYVLREFKGRHPYTKRLTRAVLARPGAWAPVPTCGRLAARTAGLAGLDGAAGQICSALFTAAYWRGVADQLGRSHALALTADHVPASVETVA